LKLVKGTRLPFSYAFVKFDSKGDASEAFQSLNGNIECGGAPLRLGWAKRNRRLHVGNSKYEHDTSAFVIKKLMRISRILGFLNF
jgi:hypothetical protein